MFLILFSLSICLAAVLLLLWMLRRNGVSLGLPIAYLFLLLREHVPGAYVHLIGEEFFFNSAFVETGIWFTAIGSLFFVAGVWVAGCSPADRAVHRTPADRQQFVLFCLISGWLFTFGLRSFLIDVPSIGALVDKGGAIWILGVLLGLRQAVWLGDLKGIVLWLAALVVYPTSLLLVGFAGIGTQSVIIVICALTVSARKFSRILVGIAGVTFVGLSFYVNYFEERHVIRQTTWELNIADQLTFVASRFSNMDWFDQSNPRHLHALDQRLNQNYFVGIAAVRIQQGLADYLYGQSILEGIVSLVPRAAWPDKPVFGGSGDIVANATGLQLSKTTSWGVGNVMEFYINFGYSGLIVGFFLLGWLLRTLDRQSAVAERRGELGKLILSFLPALALIGPLVSMVELVSGSAAALLSAFCFKWIWETCFQRHAWKPSASST